MKHLAILMLLALLLAGLATIGCERAADPMPEQTGLESKIVTATLAVAGMT